MNSDHRTCSNSSYSLRLFFRFFFFFFISSRRCRYGLRSIARTDPYFGAGEKYWLGPVWLSTRTLGCYSGGFLRSRLDINYLTLAALHNVYMQEGPYAAEAKQAYMELRQRLIANMVKVRSALGRWRCGD